MPKLPDVRIVAVGVILLAGLAYFAFLISVWNQYEKDRVHRDDRINELLDRLPKKPAVADES